jgi:hypothetical protein
MPQGTNNPTEITIAHKSGPLGHAEIEGNPYVPAATHLLLLTARIEQVADKSNCTLKITEVAQ